MKKVYLLSFVALSAFVANSQKNQSSEFNFKRSDVKIEKAAKPLPNPNEEKALIWGSDFSNPADWIVAHDVVGGACDVDFQIGAISCQGDYAIADIASTTAANGWALLDSDFAACETVMEDSWMTMALPVNLSANPNVIVEFETYYRAFNNEKPYLVVGIGDGMGNVTWPTDLNPQSDLTAYTGVYDIFPERAYNEQTTGTANPQKVRINISAVAGGASEVFIRFNWTGLWGYAWFIDDFKIVDQPLDDMESLNAYVVGTNNEGIEYGRTPVDQLDASWDIGGQVLNFGVNDQTNVTVDVDFVSFNANFPLGTVLSGDTASYVSTSTPALTVGQYDGVYTVTSDMETSASPEFFNNVLLRNFAVTNNLYSQDGIGIHPTADLSLSSLGSNSFTGMENDTYLANMYHLRAATNVISGFEIGLSSGTMAGSELEIFIIDTAMFFTNGLTPAQDLNGNSAQSLTYIISQSEITAGVVSVGFLQPITLAPNAYFAVVKTIDPIGGNPVRVLDDQTVAQPSYASMINVLDDNGNPTSYTNGNSFAIRLKMGDQMGVESIDGVSSINVYPNPANTSATISMELNNEADVAINVTDLAGKVVYSTELGKVNGAQKVTVNTDSLTSGVYMVSVTVDGAVSTQKLVVRK